MSAWGKKNETAELPLEEHMLDVSETFRHILSVPVFRSRFETALGRTLDEITEQRLLVLAALHDVGKLCDNFQEGRGGHSSDEGWQAIIHHAGEIGVDLRTFFSPPMNEATAIFSHHGYPNTCRAGDVNRNPVNIFRAPLFSSNAKKVAEALRSAYPAAWHGNAPSVRLPPPAQHLFAGLLTIADQIGSGEDRFPIERGANFRRDPEGALRAVGLDPGPVFGKRDVTEPEAFGWPAGSALSEIQQRVMNLPLTDRLVIIESETGSGKTEAALLRFFRLLDAGLVGSLYFAVPTRSAASQIQRRVNEAVARMYGAEAALAVPGYLRYGTDEGRKEGPFDVVWGDDGRKEESRWAADAPRKFLAAPVAVGTVDQVLMAGLKRKWAHMRAAALSRSLLVVDEVHASDDYMTEILSHVLRDHLAVGGHAVLLSATLGSDARRRIVKKAFPAAAAKPLQDGEQAPYPCLWAVSEADQSCSGVTPPEREKSVRIIMGPAPDENDLIAKKALEAARAGARVLVIRNSVRSAVSLARSLLSADPDAPLLRINGLPVVHHSRFPAQDRKTLDVAVERVLGKGSPSGSGAIVIGTQTLEQSLDIDADLLITDPCPIDVMLQRIGRLHRHHRDDRPEGFEDPACVILDPSGMQEGALRRHGIGSDRAYPSLTAIAALTELASREVWSIPSDNRELVEFGTTKISLQEVAKRHGMEKDFRSSIGRGLGDARFAEMNVLDRTADMHGAGEWPKDHIVASRLGDLPVAAELDRPVISALGNRVAEVLIPIWMFGNADGTEDGTASCQQGESRFTMVFRGKNFVCDNFGLRES